jgi:hypothetical protein
MPFNVEAITHDRIGFAAIGNQESARLLVSVTDDNHKGVAGLKAGNFKVSQPAAAVKIVFKGTVSGAPGVYRFDLERQEVPWSRGIYHFIVHVTKVSGLGQRAITTRGQTLATLTMQ